MLNAETTQLDLTDLNAMFEHASPQKIVEWTIAQWGDDAVTTSSFGTVRRSIDSWPSAAPSAPRST